MSFLITGDAATPACDCGITNPGTFFMEDWGTDLADLVAGGITVDLAGWKNCYCSSGDTDGDGVDDDIEVDCARAELNLNFHLLVGTDYLVTWAPLGAPGKVSGETFSPIETRSER